MYVSQEMSFKFVTLSPEVGAVFEHNPKSVHRWIMPENPIAIGLDLKERQKRSLLRTQNRKFVEYWRCLRRSSALTSMTNNCDESSWTVVTARTELRNTTNSKRSPNFKAANSDTQSDSVQNKQTVSRGL